MLALMLWCAYKVFCSLTQAEHVFLARARGASMSAPKPSRDNSGTGAAVVCARIIEAKRALYAARTRACVCRA